MVGSGSGGGLGNGWVVEAGKARNPGDRECGVPDESVEMANSSGSKADRGRGAVERVGRRVE